MNLGTARILIIVGLALVGAAVLASGFDDEGGTVSGPSPSVTPSPGASPTGGASPTSDPTPTETPTPQTQGVSVMVLNGTSVQGLAAEAQQILVGEGYVAPVDPDNAPNPGAKRTTVYFRPGENEAQNRSDATYASETLFPGSKVAKLGAVYDDIVPNSATIVVVVGQDFADSVTA